MQTHHAVTSHRCTALQSSIIVRCSRILQHPSAGASIVAKRKDRSNKKSWSILEKYPTLTRVLNLKIGILSNGAKWPKVPQRSYLVKQKTQLFAATWRAL